MQVVVSLQSFEHFDVISMADDRIDHGKLLSICLFIMTLTLFDFHFRWSFSENRAREKKLMRHHHVISIVCTLVTWDQAQFYQFSYILSYAVPLKLGLIQSLTSLCGLRPDFGRNADWLLEQHRGMWLVVEINGSWKRLFLAWLIALNNLRDSREKDFAVFFFFFF